MTASPIPTILTLGPLLGIEDDYRYTVCFLLSGNHSKDEMLLHLKYNDAMIEVEYEYSKKLRSCYFYRYTFIVPKNKKTYPVIYNIAIGKQNLTSVHDAKEWTFHVPGEEKHPKIAFMSCNGDSSHKPKKHPDPNKYLMWSKYMELHNTEYVKFNAMIMSGDQVYADTLWNVVPYFKDNKLHRGSDDRFLSHTMSDKDEDQFCSQLSDYYENLYIKSWTYDENMSEALASIPSIMMWDDHDIFDGYGSHSPELQNTKLFKTIFKVAKTYFELLQIRSKKNQALLDIDLSYNSRFTFRNYDIVVLDNRTKRTQGMIMHPNQYKEIEDSFTKRGLKKRKGALKDQNVICFVIPVPIGHLNYSKRAERMMQWFFRKKFRKSFNDDGIDHWDHKKHETEHKKLLDMIMNIAMSCNPKYVLAISGDVHSAGAANIYRNEYTINQYISSPMAHKTAGWFGQLFLDWLSSKESQVDDYEIKLMYYGPTYLKTIYSRNFGYLYKKRGGPLTGYLETEKPLMDGEDLKKKLKLFIDKEKVKALKDNKLA